MTLIIIISNPLNYKLCNFLVTFYGFRWVGGVFEELQKVVSHAECAAIQHGRADDHEPPRIDMGRGEVQYFYSGCTAALDLCALEMRAADAEEGNDFPVCIGTLVLNDPIRLPCEHLICN